MNHKSFTVSGTEVCSLWDGEEASVTDCSLFSGSDRGEHQWRDWCLQRQPGEKEAEGRRLQMHLSPRKGSQINIKIGSLNLRKYVNVQLKIQLIRLKHFMINS